MSGARPAPSFDDAARFWLALGWYNFGGPAGQIAIMQRELVERRGWIDQSRFLHALNYCMLLPGPEAMQLATYVGWLMHGTRGAILAGCGFCAPAVLILFALSWLYVAHGDFGPVAAVLAGFKPVVVAIVLFAVYTVGRRALTTAAHVALAVTAFAAIQFANVPFPVIVVAAMLVGLVFARTVAPAAGVSSPGPAPTATRWRTVRLALIWLALSLAPLALLAAIGAPSILEPVYVFFTKAAYVTFGGAYAVLAYVNQAAVEQFAWLTAEQAIDGFALAETTPGPLIMVVQFVGFIAGWNAPQPWPPAATAAAAALLTSYATFIPSFFFILVGAPYLERLRGIRRLDAALGAVTAAVVGVILSLGVVFATAVLWRPGAGGGPNAFAGVVMALAALALWRRVGVPWIVLGGGCAGLLAYVAGWIGP